MTILNEIHAYARQFTSNQPKPGRLETGWFVRQRLTEYATHPAPPFGAPPVDAMFGVPVVVVDSMHPCAWRLLDTDGATVSEGHIEPDNLPDRYESTFDS